MTWLNLKGIEAAGKAEFFLTAIKLIPLFLIPFIAIFKFDINNFYVAPEVASISLSQQLSYVTLMTLWGFIGVESATTAADSVENPTVTIPKAIILGTICVAAVYFFNSLSILGIVPGNLLQHSAAPYVDAAKVLFGGNWYLLVSGIASIICIGTLNAWILASGQIALGLAQDKLLPSVFSKKNKNEAPSIALIASSIGILPLLTLTVNTNIAQQINSIIDFSVIAFLFVYLICCFSLLKILIKEQMKNHFAIIYTLIAILFCSWVILKTSLFTSLKASFFTLTGIPFYFYWLRSRKKSE
jgi:APA family basic amino acid/polyamine antiporter